MPKATSKQTTHAVPKPFVGRYPHKIDENRRSLMPLQFRKAIKGAKEVYCVPYIGEPPYLALYREAPPNPELAPFCTEIEYDEQGRVVFPLTLLNSVGLSGKMDILYVGWRDHIRVFELERGNSLLDHIARREGVSVPISDSDGNTA